MAVKAHLSATELLERDGCAVKPDHLMVMLCIGVLGGRAFGLPIFCRCRALLSAAVGAGPRRATC